MNKSIFFIITIGLSIALNNITFAQTEDNNLYFLADTVNIPKEQRIVSINKAVPSTLYENEYEFFCKCISPYQKNLVFFYINTDKHGKENILKKKPNYRFISWKELMMLVEKYQNNFDNKYNLHIVETLPGNRYKTNVVKLQKYTSVN